MRRDLALVVAMARGGAIGRDNALPWRLPEDLRRFRALTLGHAVIMGRRTWDSIGRNLPGRTNIVITRDPGWHRPDARIAADLDAALTVAQATHPGQTPMVIGGAQIYALALPRAALIHATEIARDIPDADAFFPPLDPRAWIRANETTHSAADGTRFVFVDRVRVD
jgi:dihydrofolate reductase